MREEPAPARCFPYWRNDDFSIFHEKMRFFPYWRNDSTALPTLLRPTRRKPSKPVKPVKAVKPVKPDFEISGFLVQRRVSETS